MSLKTWINFVSALILLIDVCSSRLFFCTLISIATIALSCLELIVLLLEHKGFISYCKSRCSVCFANDTICWPSNIHWISQLNSDTSKVLQKSLKYFNGTAISTFAIPALLVLFVSLDLYLNDSESVVLPSGSLL